MEEEKEKPKPKPNPKPKPRSNKSKQNSTEEPLQKDVVDVDVSIDDENRISTNFVTVLLEQNKNLDKRLSELEEIENEKQTKLETLRKEIDILKEKSSQIELELKNDDKNNVDDKASQEMQQLLSIYDLLKQDEKKFKQMCQSELERLETLSLQAGEKESETESEVHEQLKRAQQRVEAGKLELASISRKLATLKREIEMVPNRTELREYRLRFVELYNQVSATHSQTKNFFSLYNSLEDTKRYMEKELSLLNSIVDSYQEACQNANGREQFSQQLSTLYSGMKETCSKVDSRFQQEKNNVEKLQQEMSRLVELKASSERVLRELENECRVNEQLSNKKNEQIKP